LIDYSFFLLLNKMMVLQDCVFEFWEKKKFKPVTGNCEKKCRVVAKAQFNIFFLKQ